MAQYLENHTGYERAWLGPWEHVRGNETDESGRLKIGRAGWLDEVMRFYDRFLKGVEPAVEDPTVAVQTNDGVWRAEAAWPPADAASYTSPLRAGTYTDDGTASSTGSSATTGVWTISPPLPYAAHLAGSGRAVVDVSTSPPHANLMVDVYDLNENGRGPIITRQGHLIRGSGPITLDLWSADWKLAPGHRIAVRVTDANTNWWLHVPTKQTVTVHGGSMTLPFLGLARTATIEGAPGTQLPGYLAARVTVPASTLQSAESDDFVLPPPMSAP